MNVLKYKHACFTVEHDGQILVVDPGSFSDDFIAPANVVGIVITHQHDDHFDQEQIANIIDKNPEAIIIAHPSVIDQLEAFKTRSVNVGDNVTVGHFRLSFSGGEHALIHKSIPVIANLGVMINDLLYYPGDSFYVPEQPIDTLALPAAAPWMKIGEAMDYLAAVRPRFAFPTHDAILSDGGRSMVDQMLSRIAVGQGTTYQRLDDRPLVL